MAEFGLNDERWSDIVGVCDDAIPFINAFEERRYEAASALALAKIGTQLERIADALDHS